MAPSSDGSTPRARSRWSALAALPLLALVPLAACNSGSSSGGDMIGSPGEEMEKPDGSGTFFVDANKGGEATTFRIRQLFWGRLVDVHDVDPTTGDTNPAPIFRDFVINQTVQTDGQNYLLDTNPVTQKTRLIVLATKGDGEFLPLLKQASSNLSPILAKSDKPGTLPPFSFVARNAALVVQFDDLLKDDQQAELKLPDNVLVLTDYPPDTPFLEKRMFFDPNHGGIGSDGKFHSTRVVIDTTVSEAEAVSMPVPTGLNSLGLPASLPDVQQPNVSVRIPTEETGSQFTLLTNLAGNELATDSNGPVDFSVPTVPVVRAMRAGNQVDENNGFLLDLNPPQLLGGWQITVDAAQPDPAGEPGFDFLVDLTFTTPCQSQPQPGNVIQVPGGFFEVTEVGVPPSGGGQVAGLKVRSLDEPVLDATDLLGGGFFERTFDPGLFPTSLNGCWVGFAPLPGIFPSAEVAPSSGIVLRFSEPMDPASVTPFDTFMITRTEVDPQPLDIVVGEVLASGDVKTFTYSPVLPFAHSPGSSEQYYINLLGGSNGISDLAGNPPVALPAQVPFTLDPSASEQTNGGVVLRFSSLDELGTPAQAEGSDDIRGQFLFDSTRGVIKPRPVVRASHVADRTQPIISLMAPFGPGVQTPLSPLGSKMMTVWRYCDFSFSTQDESNHNLDVEGINWAPIGGQVVADNYPEFEMRLSHGKKLPDEHIDPGSLLPTKPQSGLETATFAQNVLQDPLNPQVIVHPRGLGYVVNPLNKFKAASGTDMMPYPFNESTPPSEDKYVTWRDTAVLAEGGDNGNGIDMSIMADAGLILPDAIGQIAPNGQVPSIGLPLLMEFRTYPAETAVGLNAFDVSLALNSSRRPTFRIFSTGGLDTSGSLVVKNPDLETSPSGGFNPSSTPLPGAPTPPDDPVFYIGQLDTISRVSRVHTVWIDLGQTQTDFVDPVIEPAPNEQPGGTQLLVGFRGATGIAGKSAESSSGFAFQAEHIDPYGDVRDEGAGGQPKYLGSLNADITFLDPTDPTWQDDVDLIDGSKFVQMRFSFVGNTTTLLSSELSAVGLAFTY